MKKSLLIPVALFAALPSLSAFTLDFSAFFDSQVGPDGDFRFTADDSQGNIAVNDFGEVVLFLPEGNSNEIAIDDQFGAGALEFDDGESIAIQFGSSDDFTSITSITTIGGAGSATVDFTVFDSPTIALITWEGPSGGITSLDFNNAPIPEPSTALLGGLGMLALLRRRR